MPGIRVYADTSVHGGILDEEFSTASVAFFEQVRGGRFDLVISAVLGAELEGAPAQVRELYGSIRGMADPADVSAEAVRLQQAYLAAAILAPRWETDALHVALATVSRCRVIVSWKFRHIVNFNKIPLYNEVNAAAGHGGIAIHTPQEVIEHEDENI